MKKIKKKKETNLIPARITTGIRAEYHLNKKHRLTPLQNMSDMAGKNQELTTFEGYKNFRSIKYFCLFLGGGGGQEPPSGLGPPHSQGRESSSSQRPLPDNTQHSQQTNIHAPGGIRTHNLSRRAAADLRLSPRGHWDRNKTSLNNQNSKKIKMILCT